MNQAIGTYRASSGCSRGIRTAGSDALRSEGAVAVMIDLRLQQTLTEALGVTHDPFKTIKYYDGARFGSFDDNGNVKSKLQLPRPADKLNNNEALLFRTLNT